MMMLHWALMNIPFDQTESRCCKYPGTVTDRHWKLERIKEVWPDPGTVFTFVRNPYDRLVSQFHWIGQVAKKRLSEKHPYAFEKSILYDIRESKSYDMGFDRYVRKLYNKEYDEIWFDKWYHDNGWNRADTQASWIEGGKVDIIIKLEEINTKFPIIQELLGCNEPFPSARNPSKHDHYSTYYTQETKDMVVEMFYKDFETFDYKIE
jgi:hypothetical protein